MLACRVPAFHGGEGAQEGEWSSVSNEDEAGGVSPLAILC